MLRKKITLKALRVNKNISAQDACEKLGIARTTLWGYETGKKYPTIDIAYKMCMLYDCVLDDIDFLLPS